MLCKCYTVICILNIYFCLRFVVSSGMRYHLRFQRDGNLILRSANPDDWTQQNVVVWASGATGGTKPFRLKLQRDYNLILLDADGTIHWTSQGIGKPTCTPSDTTYLNVQNDGNVVVYTNGAGHYVLNN